MGRPIGCTTENWPSARTDEVCCTTAGSFMDYVPFLGSRTRNFAKPALDRERQSERRGEWVRWIGGEPQSPSCLGNRIDQRRGRLLAHLVHLVLTSRSPCAARGDAPVNHPTHASSSPCGPCLRGLTLFSPTYYLGRPAIHPSNFTDTAFFLGLLSAVGRVSRFAITGNQCGHLDGLIRGSMRIGGDARIVDG